MQRSTTCGLSAMILALRAALNVGYCFCPGWLGAGAFSAGWLDAGWPPRRS
jgi:hypothetical protein